MRSPILSALLLASAMIGANAQDSSLQRRDTGIQNIRPLSEQTLPAVAKVASQAAESSSSANQSAYGEQEVLVRNDPWQFFSINASASYTYQTNAALSPVMNEEDEIFSQNLSLAATVPLSSLTAAPLLTSSYISLSVQEQTLRYRELDILDFDRVDTSANFIQLLPGQFVATLGARYYRLSLPDDFGEELFANFSATAGLSRLFTLGRNSTLFIGANADVSLSASAEEAQRDEYSLIGVYTIKLAPRWKATATAGVSLLHYDQHDDLNYSASVALDYVPREWFSIGGSLAYFISESNLDTFDYENTTAGPTLRASFRF